MEALRRGSELGRCHLQRYAKRLYLAAGSTAGGYINHTGGFAGQNDWYVPNFKDLGSIVERKCKFAPSMKRSFQERLQSMDSGRHLPMELPLRGS